MEDKEPASEGWEVGGLGFRVWVWGVGFRA